MLPHILVIATLYTGTFQMAAIQDPYPSLDHCRRAGDAFKDVTFFKGEYACIPAPEKTR